MLQCLKTFITLTRAAFKVHTYFNTRSNISQGVVTLNILISFGPILIEIDHLLKDVRNFATRGSHSLLWPEVTIFLSHLGAYCD